MKEKEQIPLTPFDELCWSNSNHLIKLLLPYLPANMQAGLAISIKYRELQAIMNHFHHSQKGQFKTQEFPFGEGFSNAKPAEEILEEITPFLPSSDRSKISQMKQFLEIMKLMTSMQQTQEGTDSFAFLSSLLSKEQQEQFEQYSHLFNQMNEAPPNQKSEPAYQAEREELKNGNFMDQTSGTPEYESPEAGAISNCGQADSREERAGTCPYTHGTDYDSK